MLSIRSLRSIVDKFLSTLLYFKLLTKLLPKTSLSIEEKVKIPLNYIVTSSILICLLLFGTLKLYEMQFISSYELLIPLGVLLVSFVLLLFSSYKKAHRIKEYNCGEKDSVEIAPFYFHLNDKYLKVLHYSSRVFLGVIILVGVI